MLRILSILAVWWVVSSFPAFGCGFVPQLTAKNESLRIESVKQLRSLGPAGLELALAQLDELQSKLASATDAESIQSLTERVERCRRAVDQVAGQRDATASRLFWHTDLEAAKSTATETGKPILSLRMLGKLTDEYSCANSRFFRTALYANVEISDYLRENFVLHWQSVRPVPKVTIDFGDGRELERTVTGNSAHYLLSADGRPIDVLPGLYGPKWFHNWLKSSVSLHGHFKDVALDHRRRYLAQAHAQRFTNIGMRLSHDLHELGRLDVLERLRSIAYESDGKAAQPKNSWESEPAVQITKSGLETPILRQIRLGGDEIEKTIDEELWNDIATLHREGSRLDEASVKLIRREHPTALAAQPIAPAKAVAENPILRIVRKFEDSIALDSVRNEYLLHRRIHMWFARGDATADVDALNERVYAELFLTPSSDPWLGLAPADGYTALDRGGLSTAETR